MTYLTLILMTCDLCQAVKIYLDYHRWSQCWTLKSCVCCAFFCSPVSEPSPRLLTSSCLSCLWRREKPNFLLSFAFYDQDLTRSAHHCCCHIFYLRLPLLSLHLFSCLHHPLYSAGFLLCHNHFSSIYYFLVQDHVVDPRNHHYVDVNHPLSS